MQNPDRDPATASPPQSPVLSITFNDGRSTVPPPSPTSQETSRLSPGIPQLTLCTALIDTPFEDDWSDLPSPEEALEPHPSPRSEIFFHEDEELEPTHSAPDEDTHSFAGDDPRELPRPRISLSIAVAAPPNLLPDEDTHSFAGDEPRKLPRLRILLFRAVAATSPSNSSSSSSSGLSAPSSPDSDHPTTGHDADEASLAAKKNQVSSNPTGEPALHPAAAFLRDNPDRTPACKSLNAIQDEIHTWLCAQQPHCSACGQDLAKAPAASAEDSEAVENLGEKES